MSRWEAFVEEGRVRANVDISSLTTYKLGGPARYLLDVREEADLLEVLPIEDIEVLVVGRGSNLVVADEGFDGLVVRLGGTLRTVAVGETVQAGGATPLPTLAREASRAGRGGLEFYVGIPGSVGGAVRMNAGCHGSDTSEWLSTARIVSLGDGSITERTSDDLELEYRSSALGMDEVVLSASYRTVDRDPAECEKTMRDITRWRREYQPGGTLNAGSVFRNPPGDAAGRIIDALGLKGFRVGSVSVSEKHANFFVAEPGATASDAYELVANVRSIVLERAGVDLQPEICFVGFGDP